MRQNTGRKRVNVYLTQRQLTRIEKIRKERELTFSEALRYVLDSYLDYLDAVDDD